MKGLFTVVSQQQQLIYLGLLLCGGIACAHETVAFEPPPPACEVYLHDSISFLLNGADIAHEYSHFPSCAHFYKDETYYMRIALRRCNLPYRSSIFCQGPNITMPFKMGTSELKNGRHYPEINHDYIYPRSRRDKYHLDTTEHNTATICGIDVMNHRFSGTFEVHFFLVDSMDHRFDLPEELHFTDGYFCLPYDPGDFCQPRF